MLLLDSLLRPPGRLGPEPLLRLTSEVGADGLAVGVEGTTRATLEALLAAGAPVRIAAGLVPPAPLLPHKRLPSLVGDDADERQAALTLVRELVPVLTTFDVRLVTLALGPVGLGVSVSSYFRFCERRSWDDATTDGPELWQDALAERKGRAERLLDNARFSLERLVDLAESSDLRFALEVAATPWAFPSPREALLLRDEYRGAPLGLVWDRARLAVLHRLGLAQPKARLEGLAQAALVAREHDAVGWEVGFLPGLGEPMRDELASAAQVLASRSPAVPRILTGRPDSTVPEIVEALVATRGASSARA